MGQALPKVSPQGPEIVDVAKQMPQGPRPLPEAANDPNFEPHKVTKPSAPKVPGRVISPNLLVEAAVILNALLAEYHETWKDKVRNCEKKLKPFKLHKFGDKDLPMNKQPYLTDSHHIFKNAYFQTSKDRSAKIPSTVCNGYLADYGLSIPLDRDEHKVITEMQANFLKNNTPPYYFDNLMMTEIIAEMSTIETPKIMDPEDLKCVIVLLKENINKKCPSVGNGKTPLLTPGR